MPSLKRKPEAVLLVFGTGGHNAAMNRLINELAGHISAPKFVAICEPVSKVNDAIIDYIEVPEFRMKSGNLIANIFTMMRSSICVVFAFSRLMLRYRIKVAISTGPGIAIPALFFAVMMRKKTIFLESWSRFYTASFSGRVCKHFVDHLYFQNKECGKFYPKGIWSGRL